MITDTLYIQYLFRLPDDSEHIFELNLDAETLQLVTDYPQQPPPWTELDFHKCPNSTLSLSSHPHCPVAINLINVIECFHGIISYEPISIEVKTKERVVSQKTTMQRALSSIIGLIMATCGCLHTAFLKPMARFHLPLACMEETVYRAASMYLMAQYFMINRGEEPDLTLKGLVENYNNIQIVNKAFADRLRSTNDSDCYINAITLLDMFAKTLPISIEETLENIRYLFAS